MTIDAALTDEGRAEVEALARRNGVSSEAILVLLRALERGGGEQAQFSHPDLGGMGQWTRHGMVMVGDMFNDALKARVDGLCRDTAALLGRSGLMHPEQRAAQADAEAWWLADLGRPSASGAQNDMRYACFPETRRLAIKRDGRVELYDTGEHRIHGVCQQQGHSYDLRFTSQLGAVALGNLQRIGAEPIDAGPRGAAPETRPMAVTPAPDRPGPSASRSDGADILDTLERLHDLQHKGVLTEAEFAEKKKQLLDRL